MPILTADTTSITKYCAACGAEETIQVPTLEIGFTCGDRSNPNVIRLPECACGAVEELIETFDSHPPMPGTPFEEHKKVVNALAAHLKQKGAVHKNVTPDQRVPPMMGALDGKAIPRPDGKPHPAQGQGGGQGQPKG